MKLIRLIILFIIIAPPSSIVYAELTDDAISAIEESYIAILDAERVGGNVTVVIMMLNQALDLTAKGGLDNLVDAITISNDAKSLALSIEQYSRTEQIYVYSKLLVFLIISFLVMIFVKKYGNRIYYSLWASIKSDWKIEKV